MAKKQSERPAPAPATSAAAPAIEYQITDKRVLAGPNTGKLYLAKPHPKDNYLANSVKRWIDVGVTVAVPDGVTIEIDGIFENEAIGLNVVSQRIVGPTPPEAVHVRLCNNANATIPLKVDQPIASIRAVRSTPALLWAEHSPETPQEKEAALMGSRTPPSANVA